ncbi:MAG TPA: hypothetical protein VFJ81_02575 [Gemmatimonadales bacterium]|nr:hypothetical protein [Gemmatimonadales bacterium]
MKKKVPPPSKARRYALCIHAGEYAHVDLVQRKVYEVWPDQDAERHGQIRVVDESGEDYLFPAEYFLPVTLPARADRVFRQGRRARVGVRLSPRKTKP